MLNRNVKCNLPLNVLDIDGIDDIINFNIELMLSAVFTVIRVIDHGLQEYFRFG